MGTSRGALGNGGCCDTCAHDFTRYIDTYTYETYIHTYISVLEVYMGIHAHFEALFGSGFVFLLGFDKDAPV